MKAWLANCLNTDEKHLAGRLRYLLFGQFTFVIGRWYRRHTCREHKPYSVRIGKLQEFLDGGNGRQQVRCGYCGVVLQDFA